MKLRSWKESSRVKWKEGWTIRIVMNRSVGILFGYPTFFHSFPPKHTKWSLQCWNFFLWILSIVSKGRNILKSTKWKYFWRCFQHLIGHTVGLNQQIQKSSYISCFPAVVAVYGEWITNVLSRQSWLTHEFEQDFIFIHVGTSPMYISWQWLKILHCKASFL